MDFCLSRGLLRDLYYYVTWKDLAYIRDVPETIWKREWDKFYNDDLFKRQANSYWGKNMNNIPYKVRFLIFIEFTVKYETLFPNILLKDKDFIYMLLKEHGYNGLTHAGWHFSIRKESELALAAMHKYPRFMRDQTLGSDRNFIMNALKINGAVIFYLDPILRYDPEFLRVASIFFGLGYDPNNIQMFKNILFHFIKNHGVSTLGLDFLNDPAMNNMVKEAQCNKSTDKYEDIYHADRNTSLQALKDGCSIYKMNPIFAKDNEFAWTSLELGRDEMYPFLKCEGPLKHNRDFILRTVTKFGKKPSPR